MEKRYTIDIVANSYVFVLSCLFMDEDKSMVSIVNKVEQRPSNLLRRDDIQTIYTYAIANNERLSSVIGLLSMMESMYEQGTEKDIMPGGFE